MSFPDGFLWGGATAANQIEGGYNLGGRCLSFSDFATPGTATSMRGYTYIDKDGTPAKGSMLDPLPQGGTPALHEGTFYPYHEAIDFYHRYEEDIALLAEMGFKIFRMSISWSRIFPNGDDVSPNQEGLDFYRKVFLTLKKYHIEPLVTILHYDMPLKLEFEYGGWTNRRLVDLYARYAETLFQEYNTNIDNNVRQIVRKMV